MSAAAPQNDHGNTHGTRVLFVCTGNAGRSQIAQAVCRAEGIGSIRVESAGTAPHDQLHPMTAVVLEEMGLNTIGLYPKDVARFGPGDFDLVVTIGEQARAGRLPAIRSTRRAHWAVPDPAAILGGSDLRTWRVCAREIERRSKELLARIPLSSPAPYRRTSLIISSAIVSDRAFQPESDIPRLRDTGFDLLELGLELDLAHFEWEQTKHISRLVHALALAGMEIRSVRAPERGVLGGADPSDRKLQAQVIIRTVEAAAEVGAPLVTFLGSLGRGSIVPDERAESARRLIGILEHVAYRIEDLPVTACLAASSSREQASSPVVDLHHALRLGPLFPPNSCFGLAVESTMSVSTSWRHEPIEMVQDRMALLRVRLDTRSAVPENLRATARAMRERHDGPVAFEVRASRRDPFAVASALHHELSSTYDSPT